MSSPDNCSAILRNHALKPVAVIGLGCRFPGATDPESFWDLVMSGTDAVSGIPAERRQLFDRVAGTSVTNASARWGAFLPGVDLFDADFFGISPREAARMDPQQRLLLEVTCEALEDAGFPVDRLRGSRTGVYVGVFNADYGHFHVRDPTCIDTYTGTGNTQCITANRISYFLDLRGPSIAVDTSCSSSLVAVHLACQSLYNRECDAAIAAGVNLILSPISSAVAAQAIALAEDGRCKAFDSRADGIVRGEGCGVVVLKRLAKAVADGDDVRAVILGSAVNHDGRSNGLTAPSIEAQQDVIERALLAAGVGPTQISQIEAHGTGTALGDPIEIEALRLVFGGLREHSCALSSVKTNVGHLEAAAGICGLIKTVLSLKHRQIVPHLHLRQLNTAISLEDTPFWIPKAARPWNAEAPRHAGVSAFSLGGTNAHVILREAERSAPARTIGDAKESRLVLLSARNPEALCALAERWVAWLESSETEEIALSDVAFTSSERRSHWEQRLAVVTGLRAELSARLRDYLRGEKHRDVIAYRSQVSPPGLVLVFPDRAAIGWSVNLGLFAHRPIFRRSLMGSDHLVRELGGHSFLDATIREQRPELTVVASVALQIALAELWLSFGIEADAVVGHGTGEIAAAYTAGALDAVGALRLAVRYSHQLDNPGETIVRELEAVRARCPAARWIAPSADLRGVVGRGRSQGFATFLEMAALGKLDGEIDDALVLPSLVAGEDEERSILRSLAVLHCAGYRVRWNALHAKGARLVTLPAYPWQHRSFWLDVRPETVSPPIQVVERLEQHPSIGARTSHFPIVCRIAPAQGFLSDRERHCPDWRHIGPFCALLETIFASAADTTEMSCVSLGDIRIWNTMLSADEDHSGQLILTPGGRGEVRFQVIGAGNGPTVRLGNCGQRIAEGRVLVEREPPGANNAESLEKARNRCQKEVSRAEFQRRIEAKGLEFGSGSETLLSIFETPGEVLAELELTEDPCPAFRFDPSLLRVSIQLVGAVLPSTLDVGEMLAVGVSRFAIMRTPPRRIWSHVRITQRDPLAVGVRIYDAAGELIAEFEELRLDPSPQPAAEGNHRDHLSPFYRVEWQPQSRSGAYHSTAGTALYAAGDYLRGKFVSLSRRFGLDVQQAATPAIDRAGACYIASAIERLGFDFRCNGGGWFSATELIERFGVVPEQRNHFLRALSILIEDDILSGNTSGFRVASFPNMCIDDVNFSSLLERQPSLEPEFQLLECCAGKLAEVWCGLQDPLELLFAEGGFDRLRKLYSDSPLARTYNALLGEILQRLIPSIEGRIRILEIGAGTGGTTLSMLAVLPAERTEYWFTDVSSRFLARARKRFASVAGMTYRAFDVEADPQEQGLPLGSFDLVVAGNVLHATADLRRTLKNTACLLRPQGTLLLIELSRPSRWAELTFGLTRGWWSFGDPELRTESPLLDGEQWTDLLRGLGFLNPHAFPGRADASIGSDAPANVLVATWPGDRVYRRRWLAVGGDRQLIGDLTERLRARAEACFHLSTEDVTDQDCLDRIIDEMNADDGPERLEVLHLLGVDLISEFPTDTLLESISRKTGGSLLQIARSLAKRSWVRNPRIWVVTRGAQAACKTDPVAIEQTPLSGLSSVLATELPDFFGGHLDLSPVSSVYDVDCLLEEILGSCGEKKTAFRDGERLVPRLVRCKSESAEVPVRFDADGSYIVTGGTGGIGVRVASWLAKRGAGSLVLIQRGGASGDFAHHAKDAVEREGSRVTLLEVDVARWDQVREALDEIARSDLPLRGVFHTAGVYDERTLLNLSCDRFAAVLAPKVRGAWNLHRATRDLSLEHFVLFGSAVTLLGMGGVGSYTAANSFLDGLSHYRRSLGLPSLTIDWSGWSGVGMAAAVGRRRESQWRSMGLHPIEPEVALEAFDTLLKSDLVQVGVLPIDWPRYFSALPHQEEDPYFSEWSRPGVAPTSSDAAVGTDNAVGPRLRQLEFSTRRQLLLVHLRARLAAALELDPQKPLPEETSLQDLGLDSLVSVELRNELAKSLQVNLSPTALLDHPTLKALTDHLMAAVVSGEATVATESSMDYLHAILGEIESLAEDDAASQLLELSRELAKDNRNR